MPLFWLLAVLLAAGVLVMLLWPLLRRAEPTASPPAEAAELAVYRDQKQALDAELGSGTMTPSEHAQNVAELSRRLAEDIRTSPDASSVPVSGASPRTWMLAAALAVVIPLTSAALYYLLGSPTAIGVSASSRDKEDLSEQQVLAMVDTLAQRLKQNPGDGEGWALLARSYHALERYADAADAYAHANELIPNDPGLLVDYADALAMAQGRSLAGKPAEMVQRALAIDPLHHKALALAATGALEARNLDASLGYWRRLAATLPPGSSELAQVDGFMAQIAAAKAKGYEQSPTAQAAGPAREQASNDQGAPPAQMPAPPPAVSVAVAGAEAISGSVEIAPALASRVGPDDALFIFARPTEGSRMPLAVLRIPARSLPTTFRLDDSLGMAAGAKLSSASAVVVEARVSKRGTAMAQPGDFYGRLASVKPGTAGLRIVIDQTVP